MVNQSVLQDMYKTQNHKNKMTRDGLRILQDEWALLIKSHSLTETEEKIHTLMKLAHDHHMISGRRVCNADDVNYAKSYVDASPEQQARMKSSCDANFMSRWA